MRLRPEAESAITCPWDRRPMTAWAAAVTRADCEPYCPTGWHVHVSGSCRHTYAVDIHGALYQDYSRTP